MRPPHWPQVGRARVVICTLELMATQRIQRSSRRNKIPGQWTAAKCGADERAQDGVWLRQEPHLLVDDLLLFLSTHREASQRKLVRS